MGDKNTVDVIIDGKIVRVSGTESEAYLVSVSNYLNAKITSFKKEFKNYRLLDEDLRSILLQINICDDLFKNRLRRRRRNRKRKNWKRRFIP